MSDWPQNRNFPFSNADGLSGLHNAWDFSRRRIADIQQAVLTEPVPTEVACLAVSGSLNRMEAGPESDLDLLIVIDDRDQKVPQIQTERIRQHIWKTLSRFPLLRDLKQPKSDGVFSKCVSWQALTDPQVRGIIDEDPVSYGQRMQLLLDAQPIVEHHRFTQLQSELLTWYREDRVAGLFHEAGPFHWLWQDVRRYWHSIRSRACWLHEEEPTRSLEVNLKLRSSRLVIVSAFLQTIADVHRLPPESPNHISDFCSRLKTTPLERLTDPSSTDNSQKLFLLAYQHLRQQCIQLTDETTDISDQDSNAIRKVRQYAQQICLQSDGDWVF